MRTIKNQYGIPTFVTSAECRLFRKLEMCGFCELSKLTEQEQHLAENMLRQGLIHKVSKNREYGYKITPQTQTLQG